MSNLAEFLLGNLSFAYAFRSVINEGVNLCRKFYIVPLCFVPVVELNISSVLPTYSANELSFHTGTTSKNS